MCFQQLWTWDLKTEFSYKLSDFKSWCLKCCSAVLMTQKDLGFLSEAMFSCSLIHKGLSQQVGPHIWFGSFFFPLPDALPDATPKGFVSSPRIILGMYHLHLSIAPAWCNPRLYEKTKCFNPDVKLLVAPTAYSFWAFKPCANVIAKYSKAKQRIYPTY